MDNLIAGATMLKFKLDFKRNVTDYNGNQFSFTDKDGATKKVGCYLAKYNPTTQDVIISKSGDEDFSVLYFPQKSNDNVILVPQMTATSINISDLTSSIITKWAYEG